MRKDQKGMTLFEVIVTIAISSIFFALASSVVLSLVSSYKASEKVNKMNQECAVLSKVLTETIQTYNLNGESIKIENSSLINDKATLQILKFNDGDLYYRKHNKDENQLKFEYIASISFDQVEGSNLLSITIQNKDERIRIFALNIIGGITNEETNP